MKIKATQVTARELQPGDLFSTIGPEYWDSFAERDSVPDADAKVYRIEVEKDVP